MSSLFFQNMVSKHTQMKEKIRTLAQAFLQDTISIRNHLHKHPELSFQEYQTAAFIKSQLEALGITDIQEVANTGIIAKIGGKAGKTIALRADIDALPITENPSHQICSTNKGVMHACGHDMHTASLLSTARILKSIENELQGTIVLIFQPGEEENPGGAKLILDEGVLQDIKPDWILGQHVDPELQAGEVGFKKGMYMASTDEIYLTIKGTGGHAAFPHKSSDTVMATCQVLLALQQLISRRKDPTLPSVLSFGKVIAEGATNVLPDKVEVEGTFRAMNEKWRKEGKEQLKYIAQQTALAMGTTCEVKISEGYPSLKNHEALTQKAQEFAKDFLKPDCVKELNIRMGGEDFAFYSQVFPATFYRFGVKPTGEEKMPGLHTANFFPDAQALETSSATMAWLAYAFLLE